MNTNTNMNKTKRTAFAAKLVTLVIAATLVFSLAACGDMDKTSESDKAKSQTEQQANEKTKKEQEKDAKKDKTKKSGESKAAAAKDANGQASGFGSSSKSSGGSSGSSANSSSSHKHKWVKVKDTQKVWVPKIETELVWGTHKVPKTGDIICNCGARFKNTDTAGHEQHVVDHILAGEPDNFHWETVWVDEWMQVEEPVDNGHYENQTIVLFSYCETCGAVK